MSKKLIFIGGEKGGTGKSTVSMLVTDYLLRMSATFVLVEGDTGTPDVRNRFTGYVHGVEIPLNRAGVAEEAITDFMAHLEDFDAEYIVVNLPANSGETLDNVAAELIAPVAEALGISVSMVFVLGAGTETIENASQSLNSGLASIADNLVLVYNEKVARPEHHAFAMSGGEDVRQQWLGAGASEHVLPVLIDRAMDPVRATTGPLSAIATGKLGDLKVVHRTLVSRWLRSGDVIAEAAIRRAGTGEENA